MAEIKFIIGITGGSGVGKTTLIRKLYDEFPEQVCTFSLDNYYRPKEEQEVDDNGVINFDLPTALNTVQMESDLKDLLAGKTIRHQQYGFNNPSSEKDFIYTEPKKLLIIEGIFVMHYPFIRNILNYSVFLEVDKGFQLRRRLKRDVEERNYSFDEVMYQWKYHVEPAYEMFVLPHKKEVNLVIHNNHGFDDNIHILMKVIHQNLDKVN